MGQGNTIMILDNTPNFIRVLIAEDLATVHEQWKSSVLKKCVQLWFFRRGTTSHVAKPLLSGFHHANTHLNLYYQISQLV